MPGNSTEAGCMMTKMLARLCDQEIGTNGSVTKMDEAFGLGGIIGDRYIPSGRSSRHYHGRCEMLKGSFKEYFEKLKFKYGKIIASGVRLFRVLLSIENRQGASQQLSELECKEASLIRELNQLTLKSSWRQDALRPMMHCIAYRGELRLFACFIVLTRIHKETLAGSHDIPESALKSSFSFVCLTSPIRYVKEEMHKFLVKHVLPLPASSSLQVTNKIGHDGFGHHFKCVEVLYSSFQRFIDSKPVVVKQEFLLRLCFADLDDLIDDIEWYVNTVDSYDHKTTYGIGFVFTTMGLIFNPPFRLRDF